MKIGDKVKVISTPTENKYSVVKYPELYPNKTGVILEIFPGIGCEIQQYPIAITFDDVDFEKFDKDINGGICFNEDEVELI